MAFWRLSKYLMILMIVRNDGLFLERILIYFLYSSFYSVTKVVIIFITWQKMFGRKGRKKFPLIKKNQNANICESQIIRSRCLLSGGRFSTKLSTKTASFSWVFLQFHDWKRISSHYKHALNIEPGQVSRHVWKVSGY